MTGHQGSIWIIGLSAAGKSTLARLLADRLRQTGRACLLIDGDEVRSLFEERLGYDPAARRRQTQRILRLARWIAGQGVLPVVAIIHPFEDDREACRQALPGYFEVFLNCDLSECIRRDAKNVYRPALAGEARHVVGLDIPYDQPRQADLILDTARLAPAQALEALWARLQTDFFSGRDGAGGPVTVTEEIA